MASPAPALKPDILSGQLAQFIGAGDAGKYPVRIAGLHLLEGEIGGNNGRMPVQAPLADTGEELGGDKGIGIFCPQVVDAAGRSLS